MIVRTATRIQDLDDYLTGTLTSGFGLAWNGSAWTPTDLVGQGVLLAPAASARNVIQPTGAAVVPLTTKGASGQSANLYEARSFGNVLLAAIDAGGSGLFGSRVYVGTTTAGDFPATGDLCIEGAASAGNPTIYMKSASGASHYVQWIFGSALSGNGYAEIAKYDPSAAGAYAAILSIHNNVSPIVLTTDSGAGSRPDVYVDNGGMVSIGGTAPTRQLECIGHIAIITAGYGLQVKEGSNAKMGTATLVTGTKVVSTTAVTANSRILLTVQSLGTISAPVPIAVTARTAGTSFTITSSDATDTSVVAWMIVEPA